ncbi:RICIN domain-containing protein [Streptomyces sp. DH12]|uniref:RICIN domain-containing protein n=1 Tax=Streptomyces sp. DH12 TaxID=2857010 RepID=UPI001E4FFB29|nr:RICIN domain-containing protein [Streptomyces sp. DH12]
MSDRERAPGPAGARDPAAFVARLRALKDWSGLTHRELSARAEAVGHSLPRSAVEDMLARATLPPEDLLAVFVRACGAGPAETERWVAAREAMAARVRTAPREAGAGAEADEGAGAGGEGAGGRAPGAGPSGRAPAGLRGGQGGAGGGAGRNGSGGAADGSRGTSRGFVAWPGGPAGGARGAGPAAGGHGNGSAPGGRGGAAGAYGANGSGGGAHGPGGTGSPGGGTAGRRPWRAVRDGARRWWTARGGARQWWTARLVVPVLGGLTLVVALTTLAALLRGGDERGHGPRPAVAAPAPGPVHIRAIHSGLCLNERPGRRGGRVYQVECADADVPRYSLRPLGGGLWRLATDHPEHGRGCSGAPVDAPAGADAPLVDQECGRRGAGEEYRIEPAEGGAHRGHRVRNAATGLCVTVPDGARRAWTPVVHRACAPDAAGQLFSFDPRPGER